MLFRCVKEKNIRKSVLVTGHRSFSLRFFSYCLLKFPSYLCNKYHMRGQGYCSKGRRHILIAQDHKFNPGNTCSPWTSRYVSGGPRALGVCWIWPFRSLTLWFQTESTAYSPSTQCWPTPAPKHSSDGLKVSWAWLERSLWKTPYRFSGHPTNTQNIDI